MPPCSYLSVVVLTLIVCHTRTGADENTTNKETIVYQWGESGITKFAHIVLLLPMVLSIERVVSEGMALDFLNRCLLIEGMKIR